MTSTMQMIKTPSPIARRCKTSFLVQDQWKSIFPTFTTLTGSRNFIKKLMVVSLSSITYLRGIFPDRAYGDRHLSGIKLKILSADSKIESVDKFISLIKSCYDAIEKKYLCQLSIGICTDLKNQDEVLEAYHLNFRYRVDDTVPVVQNPSSITLNENDPTVASTLCLLKSIIWLSDVVGPLPKKAYLTMKLLYNDEITPIDYQPLGFVPSENETFLFPSNAVKVELGKVSTELHGYKMFVKTTLGKEQLSQLYEESVLTDSQTSQKNNMDTDVMNHTKEDIIPKTQLESQSKFMEDSLPVKNVPEKINCPCTCKQDSEIDILQCSACGQFQHSICYGILNPEENEESEFYCIQCIYEAPAYSVQQDLIYAYEGKQQQELCAMRRALVFCASLKQVTAFQLENGLKCKKELSKNLIERLEFEGFIRRSGQKYFVNENKIKNNGYHEYFVRNANKENLKNLQVSKEIRVYDVESDENENIPKGKLNFKTTKRQTRQDQFMDIDIKTLNLKDASENQPPRRSRRSLKRQNQDSDEDFQPLKRRCIVARSPLTLK